MESFTGTYTSQTRFICYYLIDFGPRIDFKATFPPRGTERYLYPITLRFAK